MKQSLGLAAIDTATATTTTSRTPIATTTTTKVEDDTASVSSTFTADHGWLPVTKYSYTSAASAVAVIEDSQNENNNSVLHEQQEQQQQQDDDECDNFSVKTHLDSVTSLPKKKRSQRSSRNRSSNSNSNNKASSVLFASSAAASSATAATHSSSSTVQFDTSSIIYHESNEFLQDEDDYYEEQEEELEYEHSEYEHKHQQLQDCLAQERSLQEYNVSARWYGPQEYKQFKLNVISIVKAVFKAQRHRARNPHQDNFSYSDTLESVYHACFQMELEVPKCNILSKQEQREFQRLYRATVDIECCLGLERLLVQRIGKDRSELRTSLFGIVQDLQTSEGWPTRELLDDNIFQISQEVSRPARLFARHLALAQAASVAKEVKHDSRKHQQHHHPTTQLQQQRRQPEERTIASLSSSSSGGSSSSAANRRNSH